MRVHLNIPDPFGCGYYRVRLPHIYCRQALAERGVELEASSIFDGSQPYDAVQTCRVLRAEGLGVIEDLKSRGTKILLDCDDDILGIPEWSPAYEEISPYFEIFKRQLEVADRITVSTEHLRVALGYTEKTDVLPNLINNGDWRPIGPDADDSIVRILWAGSKTHTKDIDRLVDAVEYFRKDAEVHVVFVGILPARLANPIPPGVTFIPAVQLRDYPSLMQLIRPHIALLPLVDHPFNLSKSNIKWLEMTRAGAACVCDPVGPYADLPRENLALGVEGDDWITPIRDLINDRELRNQLWRDSITEIENRWSWRSPSADLWRSWFIRTLTSG